MSSNRVTYGLVAVLKTEVDSEARNDLYDTLYDAGFQINYEGTLLFKEAFDGEEWEAPMICGVSQYGSKDEFISEAEALGVAIKKKSIDVYHACWYDGCDSPMSTLTKEEFLEGK